MASLFEREGDGLWAALRAHVGASPPGENQRPPSAKPKHRADHRISQAAREDSAITTFQRDLALKAKRSISPDTTGSFSVDDL